MTTPALAPHLKRRCWHPLHNRLRAMGIGMGFGLVLASPGSPVQAFSDLKLSRAIHAAAGVATIAAAPTPPHTGMAPKVAAAGSAPQPAPAPASSCQAATSTLEMQECLGRLLDRADQDLNRYVERAKNRLSGEQGLPAGAAARAVADLAASQQAWRRYRDSACQTVWSFWSGGSIRGPKLLECRISLARERQRQIWRDFLTFLDGTPPLLPEPPAAPGGPRP